MVERTYQSWVEGYKFMTKLESFKRKLKIWNQNAFRNVNQIKSNLISQTEEIEWLEERNLGVDLRVKP